MSKRRRLTGGASAISDRSGFRYPMSEMVVEEGTKLLVHKSESDGEYNRVTSPLNRVMDFAKTGDPFPVRNARPRPKGEQDEIDGASTPEWPN